MGGMGPGAPIGIPEGAGGKAIGTIGRDGGGRRTIGLLASGGIMIGRE